MASTTVNTRIEVVLSFILYSLIESGNMTYKSTGTIFYSMDALKQCQLFTHFRTLTDVAPLNIEEFTRIIAKWLLITIQLEILYSPSYNYQSLK